MTKAQSRKAASQSTATAKRAKSANRTSKLEATTPNKIRGSIAVQLSDAPVRHRADSKQARVIAMLMKPEGATVDAIMKATTGSTIRCAASSPASFAKG